MPSTTQISVSVYYFFARNTCAYQDSKFKFEFRSTCATSCKLLGAWLKILGAQLTMLEASISNEKVKSLTVPCLYVIFSLLLLFQSRD